MILKQNGGSGETTVHLDIEKNFEFVGVEFSGGGGFGGSYSSSLCEINLSNLPKQIKVGNK